MSDKKIFFEREDWTPDTNFLNPVLATYGKIWVIKEASSYDNKLRDRYTQEKIKFDLSKEYLSVTFLSSTSVYFYFSDGADEAAFIVYYGGRGFEACLS